MHIYGLAESVFINFRCILSETIKNAYSPLLASNKSYFLFSFYREHKSAERSNINSKNVFAMSELCPAFRSRTAVLLIVGIKQKFNFDIILKSY